MRGKIITQADIFEINQGGNLYGSRTTNTRRKLVQKAHPALDNMKYEIASQFNLPVHQGSEDYWETLHPGTAAEWAGNGKKTHYHGREPAGRPITPTKGKFLKGFSFELLVFWYNDSGGDSMIHGTPKSLRKINWFTLHTVRSRDAPFKTK